jgi:NAD(P)-dependent dehydrogenase (short-subunit alcohol dehydrogenase family)
MSIEAPIAVVTGSSRGAGRGIALALGAHGCTVYVTGRSEKEGDASLPGTIYATAAEVTRAGGKGIAVRCDHGDSAQVKALFEQVEREQGHLDILVNNACAIHDMLPAPGNFWEKPIEIGEMIKVGVHSGFVASWYAAPLLVRRGQGLIVFTSASGAVHYCFGPAYGAHKAGVDKMAADMAVDFQDANTRVVAVSLWMGTLATERLLSMIGEEPERFKHLEGTIESPELTGHVIWALFNDPRRGELNGQTLIGAELAKQYGIKDLGGRFAPSVRQLHSCEPRTQFAFKVK